MAIAVAVTCATSGLMAQQQFDYCPKTHVPVVFGGIERFLFLDLDGDGDLDVQPIGDVAVQVLRTSSLQYDWRASSINDSLNHLDGVAADFDGDGDLDVAIARRTFNELHLNDGFGVFTKSTDPSIDRDLGPFPSVAAGDLDGDGDVDLVFANEGATETVLRNNSPARFTIATSAVPTTTGSTATALLDVDGDGDLDLVRGSATANTAVLHNDGTGTFTPSPTALPADGGNTSEIVVGDVDADGDRDLLIAKTTGGFRLLLAQGGGAFVDASSRLPAGLAAAERTLLVDLDADGDLDVAAASTRGTFLLQNRGSSFADVSSRLPVADGASFGIGASDADGDGDQDLWVVGGRLRLYVNERGGREFVDATGATIDFVQLGSQLVDLDGDADLDLVTPPPSFSKASLVHENDGTGVFVDVTAQSWNPVGTTQTFYGFRVGDVDRDGDADLVLGQDGQDRLYLNDGRGVFAEVTATHLPVDTDRTSAIELADFDGDGDLDLAAGNFSGPLKLLRNDGTGRFAVVPGTMPAASLFAAAMTSLDADGDGDLDLAVSARNAAASPVRLYANDGTGLFTDVSTGRIPLVRTFSDAMTTADFDADGDTDLLALGTLLVNDGTGVFADETATRLPSAPGLDARFADFDADGDLDLMSYQRFFLNDGTGHFVDASNRFPSSNVFGRVPRPYDVGDVDRDGDLDMVGSFDVFKNLDRQVSTTLLPRLGQSFAVDVRVKPGYGTNDSGAVLFLAASRLSRPLRLGSLGLLQCNPLTIFAADIVSVPMATGEASRSWTIPSTGALAGFDFHAQALVLHDGSPSSWRFTNVVRETVVR